MESTVLTQRRSIIIILFLQFLPLLLFPPSSYNVNNQEWWLPAFLMLLSIFAVFELVARNSEASWPWDLISFSQGFNIISRLMLLMPHAKELVNGDDLFNPLYVVLTLLSLILSALILWFIGQPAVRRGIMRD